MIGWCDLQVRATRFVKGSQKSHYLERGPRPISDAKQPERVHPGRRSQSAWTIRWSIWRRTSSRILTRSLCQRPS